jgi:hypothetical protein
LFDPIEAPEQILNVLYYMSKDRLIIEISREDSFDCPAGMFAAKLDNVKLQRDWNGDEIVEHVRLLFEVNVPQIKHKRILTGRNFDPKSKHFRLFLESWLGKELYENLKDGGLDLQEQVGKPADLLITHHTNRSYKKPFVSIEAIHPPGTLILTEAFKEKGAEI